MSDAWHETHNELKVDVKRLNHETGEWEDCEFQDLRTGDIFRSYYDGVLVSVLTGCAATEDYVAFVESDPEKNIEAGHGYGLICTEFESVEHLRKCLN